MALPQLDLPVEHEPEIRGLLDRDAEIIRILYRQSIMDNPDGFIKDLSFHGDIIDQAREIETNGGLFLVALCKNRIGGFAALKRDPAQPDTYELCKLHVCSIMQKCGMGRALSEKLITCARARGARQLNLHVTISQKPAIALYEKLGFKKTDQKVFEIALGSDGEKQVFDTLFMSLTL